jgi:hypothetical protein
MISVEVIERGPWGKGHLPAAKITFQGKHFLAAKDVMPLFHWTRDDIWPARTSRTEVVFTHWLDAGAVYHHDPLAQLVSWKKTALLILVPLLAWVPVESWLMEVANYVSAKNPNAKIDWLEIQGEELLRSRARQLYPHNAWIGWS